MLSQKLESLATVFGKAAMAAADVDDLVCMPLSTVLNFQSLLVSATEQARRLEQTAVAPAARQDVAAPAGNVIPLSRAWTARPADAGEGGAA